MIDLITFVPVTRNFKYYIKTEYKISLFVLAVESLVSVPVKSYEDIDGKIEEGTKIRTVASTNMNATSRYNKEKKR